jgi:anti-anti-sigma factor
MAPQGTITVEMRSREVTVVTMSGEHDLGSAVEVRHALAATASMSRNLIVDLGACRFMDSTIINILLQTSHSLHTQGGMLMLVIPPGCAPMIFRVFETLGVQRVLPIYETCAAALAHLNDARPAATTSGMRLRALSEIIDEFTDSPAAQRRGA